jgi:hypothetical protein
MSEFLLLPNRGAISVKEFCAWSGIGRTKAYEEILFGRLKVKKVGRRTLIPFTEAQRWFEALPTHEETLGSLAGEQTAAESGQ